MCVRACECGMSEKAGKQWFKPKIPRENGTVLGKSAVTMDICDFEYRFEALQHNTTH